MRIMNGLEWKPFAVVKGAVAGVVASAILAGCSADGMDKYGWDWDPALAARESESIQKNYVAKADSQTGQPNDGMIVHTGYGRHVVVQATPADVSAEAVAAKPSVPHQPVVAKPIVIAEVDNSAPVLANKPSTEQVGVDSTPVRLVELPASQDMPSGKWKADLAADQPVEADSLVRYVSVQPDNDITDAVDNNHVVVAAPVDRKVIRRPKVSATVAPKADVVPVSYVPVENEVTIAASDEPVLMEKSEAIAAIEAEKRQGKIASKYDIVVSAAPDSRKQNFEIALPDESPAAPKNSNVDKIIAADVSAEARQKNLPPAAKGGAIMVGGQQSSDSPADAPMPSTCPSTQPTVNKTRSQEFVIVVP